MTPSTSIDARDPAGPGWLRDNLPVLRAAATLIAGAHASRDARLEALRDEVETFWRLVEPGLASGQAAHAGALAASIRRMRVLTDAFHEPPWACANYRGYIAGLQLLEENTMTLITPEPGPIAAYLERDHRRLEALLAAACRETPTFDLGAYGAFRTGLLRHIGLEEKILLRAARDRQGAPDPQADRLRGEHGDITSLLVPAPSTDGVALLRTLLARHNDVEEGPDGVYARCERAIGEGGDEILSRLRAAPEVRTMPFNDGPRVGEIVDRIRRKVLAAGGAS